MKNIKMYEEFGSFDVSNFDREKWERLSELWGEVYSAEDVIDGVYDPDDENYAEYVEINKEYKELLQKLRKLESLIKIEVEKLKP